MGQRSDHGEAEALLHHVVAQLSREAASNHERLEARRRETGQSARRATRIKLGIVVPIFLALTAVNVVTGGVPDTLYPDSEEYELQIRQNALGFVVDEIESYREDHGRLPLDLSALDVPEFGEWRYQSREDGHYELGLTDSGFSLRFDTREQAGSWPPGEEDL